MDRLVTVNVLRVVPYSTTTAVVINDLKRERECFRQKELTMFGKLPTV